MYPGAPLDVRPEALQGVGPGRDAGLIVRDVLGVYIYICIYTERERDMTISINIYTYTHIYIYIYICIYHMYVWSGGWR